MAVQDAGGARADDLRRHQPDPTQHHRRARPGTSQGIVPERARFRAEVFIAPGYTTWVAPRGLSAAAIASATRDASRTSSDAIITRIPGAERRRKDSPASTA